MGAEVVEPIVYGGVESAEVVAKASAGGKLEVDDAAQQDADGSEQPCLADEAPEHTPARGSKSQSHTRFLSSLTGVHEQRAEHTEGEINGEERGDEQVAVCLAAHPTAINILFAGLYGSLHASHVEVFRYQRGLHLALPFLHKAPGIDTVAQTYDNGSIADRSRIENEHGGIVTIENFAAHVFHHGADEPLAAHLFKLPIVIIINLVRVDSPSGHIDGSEEGHCH